MFLVLRGKKYHILKYVGFFVVFFNICGKLNNIVDKGYMNDNLINDIFFSYFIH